MELRALTFIDVLQPQVAGFLQTVSQGFLPLDGQAALIVEIAPTSSSVIPPRSATSSEQVSAISQTSRCGKLSLMAPVSGFTSRYRWCEQLTNGQGRGIPLQPSRVPGRSTSVG
jgi:hypothetical protein